MTSSKINQENYNIWSTSYDSYPNPVVFIDDKNVPELYSGWSNQKILEIGCGTGRHTLRFFGQGNSILGMDISDGMLGQAKTKLPEVEFVHADFLVHEFADQKFNKIFMSLVLEHISELELFFKKAFALLDENGELLISEIHPQRAEAGVLAHFKTEDEKEVWLSSASHSEKDILNSAEQAGFKLNFKKEFLGSQELADLKAKWKKYLDQPMVQVWSFFK